MLIDCGLIEKDLKDSRLYCCGLKEILEEWLERLKQFGFGAGFDDGEAEAHLYYFRWRRKAIYEQRKAGLTFKNIGETHGISGHRVIQVYAQAQKQFGEKDNVPMKKALHLENRKKANL
jgi:hypothetical protein